MLFHHTLFDTRPTLGKKKLHPLTGGRLKLLEEIGNPIGTGDIGEEVDITHIYEAYFVAISSEDDLYEAITHEDGISGKSRRLSLSLSNDTMNEFWGLFQDELQAAADKMTQPAESGTRSGKHKGGRATPARGKKKK